MKKREVSLVEFKLDHEKREIYRRFMKVIKTSMVNPNTQTPMQTVKYREVRRKLTKAQWRAFIEDTKRVVEERDGYKWTRIPKYSNLAYYIEGMRGFMPEVNLIKLKKDYPDSYEEINLFESDN